jgi:hypothetical protein
MGKGVTIRGNFQMYPEAQLDSNREYPNWFAYLCGPKSAPLDECPIRG